MILGLTGRMGSGKDTVYQRLAEIVSMPDLVVERRSFADPLKDSVCALFGIDRDQLELLKNHPASFVQGGAWREDGGFGMSMREFLQRYGTEAHRDIFGHDFWTRTLLDSLVDSPSVLTVITDCRFENESRAVKEKGGRIYEVVGPEGKMDRSGHPSEHALPAELLAGHIFNVVRDDGFKDLDDSLRQFVIPSLFRGEVTL